jgi:hypothetical protein
MNIFMEDARRRRYEIETHYQFPIVGYIFNPREKVLCLMFLLGSLIHLIFTIEIKPPTSVITGISNAH